MSNAWWRRGMPGSSPQRRPAYSRPKRYAARTVPIPKRRLTARSERILSPNRRIASANKYRWWAGWFIDSQNTGRKVGSCSTRRASMPAMASSYHVPKGTDGNRYSRRNRAITRIASNHNRLAPRIPAAGEQAGVPGCRFPPFSCPDCDPNQGEAGYVQYPGNAVGFPKKSDERTKEVRQATEIHNHIRWVVACQVRSRKGAGVMGKIDYPRRLGVSSCELRSEHRIATHTATSQRRDGRPGVGSAPAIPEPGEKSQNETVQRAPGCEAAVLSPAARFFYADSIRDLSHPSAPSDETTARPADGS